MSVANSFYLVYSIIPYVSLVYVSSACASYRLIGYLSIDLTLVDTGFRLSFDSIITFYDIKFSSALELSNTLSVRHLHEVSISI